MSMVITCESCESRFRFDEGLLKGAKGALVKCPRCRERILVRNPAAPRVMPPAASPSMPRGTPPIVHPVQPPVAPPLSPPVSPPKLTLSPSPTGIDTKIPPIRVEGQGGMISRVPPKRHAPEAGLPVMTGPGPGNAFNDANTSISVTNPGTVSPEIPGKQAQRVADLFRSPSEAEVDRKLLGDVDPPMADREAAPVYGIPPPRPLYQRPLFISAVIFVLLLSGGAFYYVDYVDGNFVRKPSPVVFPVEAQVVSGQTEFDVQSLKGFLNKQDSGESLYIIKGTVTNVGKTASRGIRIQATLFGKDNQAIMQNESFAGNQIDESLMSHMNRVRIEGFLSMRYGEGNANRDIPVGTSLPFMVVFFDPPEGIQSFTVKATDVGEAERTQSSGPDTERRDNRVSTQESIRSN